MVALPILFGRGRRVENVVVRRIMKDPIQFTKGIGKDLGCQSIVRRIHLLKAGEMGLGENPGLKRESRGKRGDREKGLVLADDTDFEMKLLPDDVTINTPIFIIEVGLASFNLLSYPLGNNRKGNDLGVRMFQRSARSNAMVLKDHDVPKSNITFQIDDPGSVGQKDIFHSLWGQGDKGLLMARRLNHHLMGADAIHLIIDPVPFAV